MTAHRERLLCAFSGHNHLKIKMRSTSQSKSKAKILTRQPPRITPDRFSLPTMAWNKDFCPNSRSRCFRHTPRSPIDNSIPMSVMQPQNNHCLANYFFYNALLLTRPSRPDRPASLSDFYNKLENIGRPANLMNDRHIFADTSPLHSG